jgi:hypothetical protein
MPACLLCHGITVEMVWHFLLDCPHYRHQRHVWQSKLCHNTGSLSFLLNSPITTLSLLKFVHSTAQFKAFFSKEKADKILTNSQRNSELCDMLKLLINKAVERVHSLS